MHPLSYMLSFKPLAALTAIAAFLAYLFDLTTGVGPVGTAILSAVTTLAVALIAIYGKAWMDRKNREAEELRESDTLLGTSLVGVSQVTSAERQAAATRADQYVTRLEEMMASQKEFYENQTKSMQSSINLQAEFLNTEAELRKASDRIISSLRDSNAQLVLENEKLRNAVPAPS